MAELVDFRTKLNVRAHAVLTAVSRSSGREMCEIAREVFDQWADERVHEANLVLRLAGSEGLSVASRGDGTA